MSNTVLCAIDISNQTWDEDVVLKAAQLAQLEGSQLDIITVLPDFGMSVVGGFFDKSYQKKAIIHTKSELKRMVAETLGAEAAGKVRHIIAVGTPYAEILSVAEKDGAALIVIGAHKPDLKDFLLGPNAARVVRHATTSVYVVR